MPGEVRDIRRLQTRQRVYEAAIAIFHRDGVLDCRIDDIARAAGVSRGTFYFHFPTKDDVLIARMRETENDIVAAIEALPESAPIAKVLNTSAAALASAWEPNPTLLIDVAAAALRLTATAPFDQNSVTLRLTLSARFCAAQARGELAPLLPAEILSDIYLGNALGGMLAWYGSAIRPVSGGPTLKTVLESVALLFLHGVGR